MDEAVVLYSMYQYTRICDIIDLYYIERITHSYFVPVSSTPSSPLMTVKRALVSFCNVVLKWSKPCCCDARIYRREKSCKSGQHYRLYLCVCLNHLGNIIQCAFIHYSPLELTRASLTSQCDFSPCFNTT